MGAWGQRAGCGDEGQTQPSTAQSPALPTPSDCDGNELPHPHLSSPPNPVSTTPPLFPVSCSQCCKLAAPPIPFSCQVRLLLLAAMAGEHILLIGPPGTAKSEVGRRLNALIDGTYFERLLTRFSVPEVK